MNSTNMLRLVLLAAIWGASFLFMRIAAPVLAPAILIEYRVALAALFLACVTGFMMLRGKASPLDVRRNWKHYLILGLFNSALPFVLFAFAARTLSASLLSVLNATAPMWGALVGAVWARRKVTPRAALGLVLGTVGVALLVGFDHATAREGALLAVAAALIAALCYSIASQYASTAKSIAPLANAHGSMWAAALLVLPLLPFSSTSGTVTPTIVAAVLALGIVSSGIAYVIYFRLIEEVGTTSALTVTFLNPLFGILWGAMFLAEPIGWHTVAGAATVLLGTSLVTGYTPAWLRAGRTGAIR